MYQTFLIFRAKIDTNSIVDTYLHMKTNIARFARIDAK